MHIDADDQKTPGAKFYQWELKGVPLRLEIGPRDIAQNVAIITKRADGQKLTVALDQIATEIPRILDEIQQQLFANAQQKQQSLWHKAAKLAEFGPKLEQENGIYQTGWCQDRVCEEVLRQYKASTRCLLEEKTFATCFNCDKPSVSDVIVAKSY